MSEAPLTDKPSRPHGALGFYLVALLALSVSLDTSWRFFGVRLHITALPERVLMFAVLEAALFACAWAMRAGVQRTGSPGPARLLAWLGCAVSAYMAWDLSGPAEGLARVVLGPVLGVVMLHQALGIEVRHRNGQRTGQLARVGRELRERVLSRLGLADDERDAATRTRTRAARRVARLAATSRPGRVSRWRVARMRRATLAAGLATDDGLRATMLDELRALRHVADLAELDTASPWRDVAPVAAPVAVEVASVAPVARDVAPVSRVESRDVAPLVTSDDTYAGGVLDATVLASGETREWPGMSKRDAVTRADELLPGRNARQVAVALGEVGVSVTPESVRTYRTRNKRDATRNATPPQRATRDTRDAARDVAPGVAADVAPGGAS